MADTVGAVCSDPYCKAVDILPIVCDYCSLVFCKDHSLAKDHNCTEAWKHDRLVTVCPTCNSGVPLEGPDEDPTSALKRHECVFKKKQVETCPVCRVKLRTTTRYLCQSCQKVVCLKHRHADDHQCNKRHKGKGWIGQTLSYYFK